jgi:demethylmenaquinone methyltransferase / 2-methoxy-6-polyprenyl-1,4-benzoquinol methylase
MTHGPDSADAPLAWNEGALRDPHAQPDKAARVEAMFDAIAPTYERFNSVATLGRDAAWRARAVEAAAVKPGEVVLDVCCGTGDMLRAFQRADVEPGLLIGIDFSGGMLAQSRSIDETAPVHLIRADALRLPLADAAVDVISCAFGVRNFDRLQFGLDEMGRVLKPGGRVVILEFATPESRLLRLAYQLYCESVLPRLGRWLSRDAVGAYNYLPRSIRTFDTIRSMLGRLDAAGFEQLGAARMNFGGVVLYRGVKRG